MAEEIVNKVAQSALEIFDLEDYYISGSRVQLDISQWLYEGLILREKEFRAAIKSQDWSAYQNQHVALFCSEDAIVPTWAYMLVAAALEPYAATIYLGDLEQLEANLYRQKLAELDWSKFRNKPVIIKGCANKPVPKDAYILAINKLQKVAKKIMYGEACSAVPLFRKV